MPQRSPVIFWLLLAATVAVDAVAMTWVSFTLPNLDSQALFLGLAFSQISVVCIWACFPTTRRLWRWLTPIISIVSAVCLTTWLFRLMSTGIPPEQYVMAYLGLWTTQVVVLCAVVWWLRQTSFGQRWEQHENAVRWQFSVKHLFLSMTILAILITILRQVEQFLLMLWPTFVVFVVNNVAVAIAAVVFQSLRWHTVLRLAGTAGIAGLLGTVAATILPGSKLVVMNLIQVIVLFLWLELGHIIPHGDPTNGEAATPPAGPGRTM